MKKAKLKLDHEAYDPEHLSIVGLSAGIDFYRMAYFIAKELEVSQSQETTAIGPHKEVLLYTSELEAHKLYLLKNVLPDGYFIPKLKSADYLIIICGEEKEPVFIKTLKQKLQSLEQVQSIFDIENRFIAAVKLKYFD